MHYNNNLLNKSLKIIKLALKSKFLELCIQKN